jgi:hypothetical protein
MQYTLTQYTRLYYTQYTLTTIDLATRIYTFLRDTLAYLIGSDRIGSRVAVNTYGTRKILEPEYSKVK